MLSFFAVKYSPNSDFTVFGLIFADVFIKNGECIGKICSSKCLIFKMIIIEKKIRNTIHIEPKLFSFFRLIKIDLIF